MKAVGTGSTETTETGKDGSKETQEMARLWQSLPPELREVVQALPDLPGAVKAGIIAMVKVASGNG